MVYSIFQATSYDQLWREQNALLTDLKSTASHPALQHAPSVEMEKAMKEQELEHMRQQLHMLGEQREKERRTASADAERLKLKKENQKLRAHIEVHYPRCQFSVCVKLICLRF